MSSRRLILVFEYLLADSAAWNSAPESMRREAAAMLAAIVNDIAALENTCPIVLLSSAAAQSFEASGRLDPRAQIIVSDRSPSVWLQAASFDPSILHATLVIAPESDGVLVSLLRQLQTGAWQQIPSLNVPWSMAETFSDKFRSFQWLRERGIATPETKTLGPRAADELCAASLPQSDDRSKGLSNSHAFGILKPRDGVGSDSVFLVPMSEASFSGVPDSFSVDDRWILQPFLPGVACSVGFIGGGLLYPTLILPAGQQEIRHADCRLQYDGGRIPCSVQLMPAVMELSRQLAAALGAFSGYVGADIVVSRDGQGVFMASVIEINPRLCTSYVGYRVIADQNLAEAMLQRSANRAVEWKPNQVVFDSSGRVTSLGSNPSDKA